MLVELVYTEFSTFIELDDCNFKALADSCFSSDKSLLIVREYAENGNVLGYAKQTKIVQVSEAVFRRNRLKVQACLHYGSTYRYYYMYETCICCYESKFEEFECTYFENFEETKLGRLYYDKKGFAKILSYKGF